MASSLRRSSLEDPLKLLLRTMQETKPTPKPLLDYCWIPRFINPPPFAITKPMICGVDCDEVYSGIFIGDEGSARNKQFLNAMGITHVLNTAEGISFGHVNTGPDFYQGTGIHYLGLRLQDLPTTRIINHFEEGVNFIHSALSSNGKVLVHCLMGLSRSTTLVLAYLIMKKGMRTVDALRMVCKQRDVRPNDGFLVQLLQQEKLSHGEKK